jgi:hypothetical protein
MYSFIQLLRATVPDAVLGTRQLTSWAMTLGTSLALSVTNLLDTI